MSVVILLLEEPSMQALLEAMLPRLLPKVRFFCIPHEGKQDLEASIPRKLRAFGGTDARFAVVRDNDRGDCEGHKARIAGACAGAGRPETLVRIVCQELEAWYFGEVAAVETEYDVDCLTPLVRKRPFRDPDAIASPARELEERIASFRKTDAARRLGKRLSATGNTSRSFNVFLSGMRRFGMDEPALPAARARPARKRRTR